MECDQVILVLARPQLHATPKRHVPRRFSPRFEDHSGSRRVGGLFICWVGITDRTSKEHMMPRLKKLLVIHTTSKHQDAASDASFTLEIGMAGNDVTVDFPTNPNQRRRGKLDIYPIDVSDQNVDSDSPGFNLVMTIGSSDGWLPVSMFVLGLTTDDELWLLGNHPAWDQGWFDTGDDPAGPPAHEISGEQIFAG
jgi:hypothetical protein